MFCAISQRYVLKDLSSNGTLSSVYILELSQCYCCCCSFFPSSSFRSYRCTNSTSIWMYMFDIRPTQTHFCIHITNAKCAKEAHVARVRIRYKRYVCVLELEFHTVLVVLLSLCRYFINMCIR